MKTRSLCCYDICYQKRLCNTLAVLCHVSVEILERPEEEIKLLIYHLNENRRYFLIRCNFIFHPKTFYNWYLSLHHCSISVLSLDMAGSDLAISRELFYWMKGNIDEAKNEILLIVQNCPVCGFCLTEALKLQESRFQIWRFIFNIHTYLTNETKRQADFISKSLLKLSVVIFFLSYVYWNGLNL